MQATEPAPKKHKNEDSVENNDMPPMPMPNDRFDHFNYDEKEPPTFLCDKEWLKGVLNTIDAFLPCREFNNGLRIPPLAISRCSRGGKTRALHEIALEVQRQTKRAVDHVVPVNVLMVSFNGNITPIKPAEKRAPLFALTRRIAFALSNIEKTAETFDRMFHPLNITEEQVRRWLGNHSWLLLIDELNNLDLVNEQETVENVELAQFLKSHFLVKPGRYFVFSTHEISTGYQLCNFMESNSDRDTKFKALPLIPSLAATMDAFGDEMHDKGKFSPRLAVYCGLVPGLIYLETCNNFPTTRRQEILNTFLERRPTDEDMVVILETVLEGTYQSLLDYPELLQLMDTTEAAKVRWIPNHLVCLLETVATSQQRAKLFKNMRGHLHKICELFGQFRDAKTQSGEGWEALFVLLVLIRAVARKGSHLLPLSEYVQGNPPTQCCVEFNSPIKIMPENKMFGDIDELDDLLDCIDKVDVKRATIGIYFPTHAAFKKYDLIVRKWGSTGAVLQTIGYQLKEGGEIPKKGASRWCDESFVIRGSPAQDLYVRNWHVASREQLEHFFGTSGAEWTPEKWRRLQNS